MAFSCPIAAIAAIVIAACGFAVPATAQSTAPLALHGVVVSEAGAALPGAHVVAVPIDGVDLKARTGSVAAAGGVYRLTGLTPGAYRVRATMIGFQTADRQVVLAPGGPVELDLVLKDALVEVDEVVVERMSMTSGATSIRTQPGSAHYLSPADLDRFKTQDIHRALLTVPGVNIQEEDGYGLRPNIGLRATGAERSAKITVMEDGVPIAPAPYSAPAAYYFPSVSRMHGIEVRKGASQIKYGPYTTGGAINLLSEPVPNRTAFRARLSAGKDGDQSVAASVGGRINDAVGVLVQAQRESADGFKELDGGGDTGFVVRDLMAKVLLGGVDAVADQSLMLKVGFADETSAETYLGLAAEDFHANPIRRYAGSQQDVMNTAQRQLVARYFARPAAWLDVTATAYRTDFSRNWYKLDRVRLADGSRLSISKVLGAPDTHIQALDILRGANSASGALEVKANNRSYFAQGLQVVMGTRGNLGAFGHVVETGIRLHRDEIDRFQWVDRYGMTGGVMSLSEPGVPGTESNRVQTARALAAYAQTRLSWGRLTLMPGIRLESIRQDQVDFGPDDPARTGRDMRTRSNNTLVWIPGLSASSSFGRTNVFAGVHRGFSPPGTVEGTRPERSVNYEVGARFRTALTYVEAAVFFNDYANLLGADLAAAGGTATGDQFNGGEATAAGLELSAGYDFGVFSRRGVSIPASISYSFTRARFGSSFESEFEGWGTVTEGDGLPYIAAHQGSVSAGLGLRRLSVDATGRYVGGMRTAPGNGRMAENDQIGAHFVIDASVRYSISGPVRMFVTAYNVTDRMYLAARRPAGLRPGLPRRVLAGVQVRL